MRRITDAISGKIPTTSVSLEFAVESRWGCSTSSQLLYVTSVGVFDHRSVNDVGESAFQAAECFVSGLAGGSFAGEVVDGSLVVAGLVMATV
jgi:hypothetical protein